MTKEQKIKQIVRQTNLLFLLADMAELTVHNLEEMHVSLGTYKFDIKHKIKAIKRHSGDLRAFVTNTYKDDLDAQISFGETSDVILERIIKEVFKD